MLWVTQSNDFTHLVWLLYYLFDIFAILWVSQCSTSFRVTGTKKSYTYLAQKSLWTLELWCFIFGTFKISEFKLVVNIYALDNIIYMALFKWVDQGNFFQICTLSKLVAYFTGRNFNSFSNLLSLNTDQNVDWSFSFSRLFAFVDSSNDKFFKKVQVDEVSWYNGLPIADFVFIRVKEVISLYFFLNIIDQNITIWLTKFQDHWNLFTVLLTTC